MGVPRDEDVSMKTSETLSDGEDSRSSPQVNDAENGSAQGQETPVSGEEGKNEEEHRKQIIDNMEKIEKEFTDLKDSLFSNSIEWLQKDVKSIKSGTHEKFLLGAESLEAERREKIWRIEQWRQYRIQNIQRMFEAEQQQANDEYRADCERLQSKMLENVQSKLSELEEEKTNISAPDAVESRSSTRQLRKRAREKEPKDTQQRRLHPTSIQYTLEDSEIAEDLHLIKRHHPTDTNFEKEKWISMAVLDA